MAVVEIPWQELSTEALLGLIEEFITRDGTDYGERELSLDEKTAQAMSRIKSHSIVIVYDELSEMCQLVDANDRPK